MSLALVRTRIKNLVAGVTDVGKVHDYFRLATVEAEVQALFSTSGVLKVWFVSLADQDPYTVRRLPANHELATYAFKVYGYQAVKDADGSEKTFADLVEDLIAAFRADKKLGDTVIEAGPLQWRQAGHRTFAGVLCHYAELDLSVLEQVEP